MKKKGTKNLSFTQRLQLEKLLQAKVHKKEIARLLGVCLSTVYAEIKRGQYEHRKPIRDPYYGGIKGYKTEIRYSPNIAEDRYRLYQSSHGVPLKLGNDWEFVRYVEKRVIKDRLSPCAVVGEMKRFNPCRTVVSKTTMYRYIAMGLFANIRMEHLPCGLRKRHYRKTVIKRPPKGISIEKRPAFIAERENFGHWEMDCVVGKQRTKNVLLVLTERKTRFETIFRMPNKKAVNVVNCVDILERRYGKQKFRKLFKSITVDNGTEFSDYDGLQRSIHGGQRTSVYYCHPYTSCERGTNERINRDIRRWFPKGTDFSKHTNKQVKQVEQWINAYPREIFDFATSAEMFEKELKSL